jgi:hypothetical protein
MGEVTEITHLVASRLNITDESVMTIIDPPFHEKDRDAVVAHNRAEDLKAAINVRGNTILSTAQPWRSMGTVGVMLDNVSQVVRANYFPVNPSHLPVKIYNYRVGIYKLSLEGEQQLEDLCNAKGEKALTTSLLRALIASKPHWHTDPLGKPVGLAYNGTTTLYTTHELDNAGEDQNLTFEISFGGRNFNVVLTQTSGSCDVPDRIGKHSYLGYDSSR